ncbi:hypothetical protein GGD65_005183 [Bradyrhizobium sp. CIR18]|nr:hypothetical protein [Bradyrhizobium sp. CIR18]
MSVSFSSERRQAATPKQTVRTTAVVRSSIDRNWLTPTPPNTTHEPATMERRFGKCRCVDLVAGIPKLRTMRNILGCNCYSLKPLRLNQVLIDQPLKNARSNPPAAWGRKCRWQHLVLARTALRSLRTSHPALPKERPKQTMKIRSLLALRALPRKLGCAFNPPSLHLSIGRRCFSVASFGRQNGFVHATVKCGLLFCSGPWAL